MCTYLPHIMWASMSAHPVHRPKSSGPLSIDLHGAKSQLLHSTNCESHQWFLYGNGAVTPKPWRMRYCGDSDHHNSSSSMRIRPSCFKIICPYWVTGPACHPLMIKVTRWKSPRATPSECHLETSGSESKGKNASCLLDKQDSLKTLIESLRHRLLLYRKSTFSPASSVINVCVIKESLCILSKRRLSFNGSCITACDWAGISRAINQEGVDRHQVHIPPSHHVSIYVCTSYASAQIIRALERRFASCQLSAAA